MARSDEPWKHLRSPDTKGSAYDPRQHGPRRVVGPGFHERVYEAVSSVPAGAVTTYGDIAGQLGLRSVARQVGYALAALPPDRDDVPWHRVVNAKGMVSARGAGLGESEQVRCLRAEDVAVDPRGRVQDFARRRHHYGA